MHRRVRILNIRGKQVDRLVCPRVFKLNVMDLKELHGKRRALIEENTVSYIWMQYKRGLEVVGIALRPTALFWVRSIADPY